MRAAKRGFAGRPRLGAGTPGGLATFDGLALALLGEVALDADALDRLLLRLQPVGVRLFVFEHVLEQLAGARVAQRAAQLDGLVEPLDGLVLDLQVELQLLRHRLAHVDLAQALEVGQPFEEQDALDERVGVLHLLDRLLAHLLLEALEAPVTAEPGMEEVLVDGGQLGRQHVVQERNDLRVALHVSPRTDQAADATAADLRGQAAQLSSQPPSRACSMRRAMSPRQQPQSVPAPQAWPTSAKVRAPSRMAESTWLSVTAWQMQRITGG